MCALLKKKAHKTIPARACLERKEEAGMNALYLFLDG
jgi:hypothetical protein